MEAPEEAPEDDATHFLFYEELFSALDPRLPTGMLRGKLMLNHHLFRLAMDQMLPKLKEQGRVNLAHLGKLFNAFLGSFPPDYKLPTSEEIANLRLQDRVATPFIFTFDKLSWRAEVVTERFSKERIWHNVLKIILPNDGLYYHTDSIKDYTIRTMSTQRHQPPPNFPHVPPREWHVFSNGYVKDLPKLMETVEAFFGMEESELQSKLQPEVAFSINASRLDMEYFVPWKGEFVGLVIQFEPLVPERLVDQAWKGNWKKA